MPRALLSLGSNIEPRRHLPEAVRRLAATPGVRVCAVSSVWRSPAVGSDGPDFLNAALLLETELPPARLKSEVLRPLEAALGRVRGADRNAPRTIDLDISLYDALVDPELGLPDPEIAERAHLALPLAELAPDARLPGRGRRLAELAAALADTPGIRRASLDLGWDEAA